jgi:hypothetical protein
LIFAAAVAELRAQKLLAGRDEDEPLRQAAFSAANRVQEGDAVPEALLHNRALPKAVDVLGANIFLNYCRLEYEPPAAAASPPPPLAADFEQDLDRCNVDIGGHMGGSGPRPRLSVKCVFLLSEHGAPYDGGHYHVLPGSHLCDDRPDAAAVPVLAPANSCLLLDRRTWHAAGSASTHHPRLSCVAGLAPRWMKARDAMFVEPTLLRRACPVLRQLLGCTTSHQGLFSNGSDPPHDSRR